MSMFTSILFGCTRLFFVYSLDVFYLDLLLYIPLATGDKYNDNDNNDDDDVDNNDDKI